MLREHDIVALTRDLPEKGLATGDIVTIVHVYGDGKAFEVEFVSFSGRTFALETLPVDAVRPVDENDVAHVRRVAAE
jgi:hypothetical protein